jgi:hypothetical protein
MHIGCSYRVYKGDTLIQDGAGETVEISSHMVKFVSSSEVPETATEISLSVPWPVSLEDGAKLQVVFSGTPVWMDSRFQGMRVAKYEFRTRPARPAAVLAAGLGLVAGTGMVRALGNGGKAA